MYHWKQTFMHRQYVFSDKIESTDRKSSKHPQNINIQWKTD